VSKGWLCRNSRTKPRQASDSLHRTLGVCRLHKQPSASENDIAKVDAGVGVVVLVVVIHVIDGDVEQPRTQHCESDVELCGPVRNRFGESGACACHDRTGTRFGRVAEAEGRVLEGFLSASADHAIGAACLELGCGAGDGADLDGVIGMECSLDFRANAKRVRQGGSFGRGLGDTDRERRQEGVEDDACSHVWFCLSVLCFCGFCRLTVDLQHLSFIEGRPFIHRSGHSLAFTFCHLSPAPTVLSTKIC